METYFAVSDAWWRQAVFWIAPACAAVIKTDAVQSLRELEQDHLIQRKVYKQVPARVEYALTADGESLIPVLSMMSVWGNERKYAWDQSAQRQYWWMYFRVLISAEVPQKQLLLTSMSVTNTRACSCFLWHEYVFCVVSEFQEFESDRCGGI